MLSSTILPISLAFLLVYLFVPISGATIGQRNALESVPDLEKAMYMTIEGYPCVRLLHLSGEIGCSNPDREKVSAPIVRLKDANDPLARPSAILVPADEMQNFFVRVSKDQAFAQKVAGVLVESGDGYDFKSQGFSSDNKFPLAEFAPYKNTHYEWNPYGSGVMWKHYNFPVFLLPGNSTASIQEMASKNKQRQSSYLKNVAEFDAVMQTTKLGTHDSVACLKAQTCLPLGGYSIWSSLPPINTTATKSPKPLVLVVSSMDSSSFFRDESHGADSPLSGMIALLAAADALAHSDGLDDLKKQIVFVVFTGEAWGYLGSRRFLAELDTGSETVKGLNSTLIEQVLEIGSVGKGLLGEESTFFTHAVGDSTSIREIQRALDHAVDSLHSEKIKMKMADTTNPGIPPSSLMAFLKKNSSIAGVVVEEFDTLFTNKFYHSHLDRQSNVNIKSIVAAASLIARSLHILAKGDLGPNASVLDSIKVNASLVDELVGCLLTCDPGLSCDLVKGYISPTTKCSNHYVGVFLDTFDTQYPEHVDDTSRFIWNFLAERTSILSKNASSCSQECRNTGEVCIKKEIESGGKCVASSTRYVPAYSTRLKYEGGLWHVIPANPSDPLGLVDSVWTESYWNTIRLRVYTVQSSAYDYFVLLGGVAVTVAAYVAVVFTRAFFMKAVKHD